VTFFIVYIQVTSLLMCRYFRPVNKDINIFYQLVNSSLCCTFLCKHHNPKSNGSVLITWQTLCSFFLEHPVVCSSLQY